MSAIKEIRSLTGLRGIAAVYVMLFHYWIGISTKTVPGRMLAHGYLSVDLFFVLSGFVMALNYSELFRGGFTWRSFWIFLGRRLARVYPLYFVASLCGLLITVLHRKSITPSPHSVVVVFANFAMVQAWGLSKSLDGASWSVSAEWAAYLLFPTVLWLCFHPQMGRTKIVLSASLIALATFCLLPTSVVQRPSATALLDLHVSNHCWPVFRCLPEFVMGVVFARLYREDKVRWLWQRQYVAGAMSLLVLCLLAISRSDFFIVVLFPILILNLTVNNTLPSRFFGSSVAHHLGLLSYSMYLVHELLEGFMGWVHHEVNLHGYAHGQTYAAAAAMMVVYPCSLFAYTFIEKPGRRFLRTRFEPQGAKRNPLPVGPLGIETSQGQ